MPERVDAVYVPNHGWVNCYQVKPDIYGWGLDYQPGTEPKHPVYYGFWKEWLNEKKHYQAIKAIHEIIRCNN